MIEEKDLVEVCIKHGASKAFVIDVDKIPFDENLRTYCEMNQCGNYGNNYACPPHVGKTKELITEAKSYKKALVYQTISKLTDSFDFEGMEEANRIHKEVSNMISDDIVSDYDRYLDLRAGKCNVCAECSIADNLPCRFPEKMRASLEAYCVDVSALAERCSMNYINGVNTVTYFGAFLLDNELT